MSASGVVGPGEGRLHWLGGISARTMVSGTANGGRFSVVEHRLRARELAAPLHRHSREEDGFTGLAGFFPADAPPDLDAMAEAIERYGLEMDVSSMPDLVARFGVAQPPDMDG